MISPDCITFQLFFFNDICGAGRIHFLRRPKLFSLASHSKRHRKFISGRAEASWTHYVGNYFIGKLCAQPIGASSLQWRPQVSQPLPALRSFFALYPRMARLTLYDGLHNQENRMEVTTQANELLTLQPVPCRCWG